MLYAPATPGLSLLLSQHLAGIGQLLLILCAEDMIAEYFLVRVDESAMELECLSHRSFRGEPVDEDQPLDADSEVFFEHLVRELEQRDPWTKQHLDSAIELVFTEDSEVVERIKQMMQMLRQPKESIDRAFQVMRQSARTLEIKVLINDLFWQKTVCQFLPISDSCNIFLARGGTAR